MHRNLIFLVALTAGANLALSHVGVSNLPSLSTKTYPDDKVIATATASSSVSGEATIPTSIFNLAKSIIGAGVLSLPSGVAFLSDSPVALVPACLVCATMGVLAAYSFSLIGKSCDKHKSRSFQDAWAKSVDPKTAWLISAGITAKCLLASLAYSIIIGDTFTALANTFNLPSVLRSRTNLILIITATVLLPLCSLQSLSALAPFSLLGLGGTLYTAIFMAIRFFEGSYSSGGRFFSDMALKPSFNKNPFKIDQKLFVLISMLSTSFIAHYNAPKFFEELKNPSISRFNLVVAGGFGIAILTNLFIMCIGFLSFGGSSQGLVLNNYSGKDTLATAARVAVGAALLTGYPFTFSALREGILDLLKFTGDSRKKAVAPFTVIALSAVTLGALMLRDVGFVVSLSGALFGCILMFVVPALMNIANLKANAADSKSAKGTALSKNDKLEINLNYGLVVTGILLTVIGTIITVKKQVSH